MEKQQFCTLKNGEMFRYQYEGKAPFVGMKVGTMVCCDLTHGRIGKILGRSMVEPLPNAKMIIDENNS